MKEAFYVGVFTVVALIAGESGFWQGATVAGFGAGMWMALLAKDRGWIV